MTTIVVVVRNIYLYDYHYYSSHSGVSHGILPAISTGCCVIMPSTIAQASGQVLSGEGPGRLDITNALGQTQNSD